MLLLIHCVTYAARDSVMGKHVYDNNCAQCHITGSGQSEAPKAGKKEDWTKRYSKAVNLAKNQGFASMEQHFFGSFKKSQVSGYHKKVCKDCSEEEVLNAIMYMTRDK